MNEDVQQNLLKIRVASEAAHHWWSFSWLHGFKMSSIKSWLVSETGSLYWITKESPMTMKDSRITQLINQQRYLAGTAQMFPAHLTPPLLWSSPSADTTQREEMIEMPSFQLEEGRLHVQIQHHPIKMNIFHQLHLQQIYHNMKVMSKIHQNPQTNWDIYQALHQHLDQFTIAWSNLTSMKAPKELWRNGARNESNT